MQLITHLKSVPQNRKGEATVKFAFITACISQWGDYGRVKRAILTASDSEPSRSDCTSASFKIFVFNWARSALKLAWFNLAHLSIAVLADCQFEISLTHIKMVPNWRGLAPAWWWLWWGSLLTATCRVSHVLWLINYNHPNVVHVFWWWHHAVLGLLWC